MRRMSVFISLLALLVVTSERAIAADNDFRITLLGTGDPIPRPERFGPSTLVEAGGQKLLIDAGRGVPIRLVQLRVPINKIDALFLTHFHSDHTSGIPDVWLTSWLFGRTDPFPVVGPVGTKDLTENLERAYAADIKIRLADEKLPAEGGALRAEEFTTEGLVYDKNGVRVSAFEEDHGDVVKPAYGYRIDYHGKSVVISGDTRFNENVIKHATGVDVLIHEVGVANPDLKNPRIERILAHHSSPREVGMVFERARPKLAVYTQLTRIGNPTLPAPSIEDIVSETRQTYQGPLQVGEDLMCFVIGDGGVAVYSRAP
jgi:ribonuclease Z